MRLPDESQPTTPASLATSKTRKNPTQTNAILLAIQAQTNAMQTQTNAILETIKTQQGPTINWTPLIQAVATAIPAVVGVPLQTPTPQTQTSVASLENQVILTKIEALSQSVNNLAQTQTQQDKILETLSSTMNILTQNVSQLTQGFNTLSQIVAAITGTPSNGQSTPPASFSPTFFLS